METCLVNGIIITPDAVLDHHAVVLRNGRIADILPAEKLMDHIQTSSRQPEFHDMEGAYLLPGLIDTHSDYIEGIIQPRPTSMMDFESGIYEAERHLIGHGITTIYHSLSLTCPRFDTENISIRQQEHVKRLVGLLIDTEKKEHLIHHKFHARYEIDNLEIYPYLQELIRSKLVNQLSFMDHTPGQGQYRDIEAYTKFMEKWRGGRTREEIERLIDKSKDKPKASFEMLKALSQLAKAHHIPLASHDDDSLEKIKLIKECYQAGISEFPITMEVARAAHEQGMHVVAGAPNVMLGGSHSGNLNAAEAIAAGCVDILCSDYYPAAMLQAVFELWNNGIIPLEQAVRLVTLNPARAMGIEAEYGSLETGKRADILGVKLINGRPAVQKCFIDGSLVMQLSYLAAGQTKGVA